MIKQLSSTQPIPSSVTFLNGFSKFRARTHFMTRFSNQRLKTFNFKYHIDDVFKKGLGVIKQSSTHTHQRWNRLYLFVCKSQNTLPWFWKGMGDLCIYRYIQYIGKFNCVCKCTYIHSHVQVWYKYIVYLYVYVYMYYTYVHVRVYVCEHAICFKVCVCARVFISIRYLPIYIHVFNKIIGK